MPRRTLFFFEAPDMGAPAVPDVPADPGVAEPAAEPWAGVTQEQWEEYTSQQQQLAQWVQQRAYQEQQAALAAQGQQQPMFDPWSEDPTAQIMQLIDSRLAPLQQTYQRIEQQEGQEQAYDVIADFVAREGDFIHEGSKELAYQHARNFLPAAIERYGYGDRAAEAALEQACRYVRELEGNIGKAYYERQTNQLQTLAGAPREPAAAGAAPQVTRNGYAPGDSVASRFFGGR